jgi:receptor protein-tyrosine kinase
MPIIERAVEIAQSHETAEQRQPIQSAVAESSSATAHEGSQKSAASQRPVFQVRTDTSPTALDLKPIVHIDFERLRAAGRVPTKEAARRTEDEMRRIKWPLLGAIAGRPGYDSVRNNVILVTSAMPGEGKTYTALNLALSIVRDRELRVILVDADVERPGLTPALGLDGSPGLNEVLEDTGRDVGSVTYQTDIEGFFVVPAGKWHDQAPEFFAGSRMPQVIEDLIRRVGNGVVVLDSPPLLATNEAQVVTRYAGQVLFVVRAEDTEQRAVREALALVDETVPISAVLNRVQHSILGSYYGQYHYGYGPGYGADRSHSHDAIREKGDKP